MEEVLLPGVGLRYEFRNHRGAWVALVALRGGGFELSLYEGSDPDLATSTLHLDLEEAEAVARVLGSPRMTEKFADLTREVPGLESASVQVGQTGPYADRPLGDTRTRTRTGASVVALVRGEQVIASPGPREVLRAGDVLVVIGTHDSLAEVARLIGSG